MWSRRTNVNSTSVKRRRVCQGLTVACAMAIVLAAFSHAQQAQAADIKTDLVAHWPLNEGTGNTVTSAIEKDNKIQISGEAKWIKGPLGKALYFNGTNTAIELGNPSALNFTGPITLAAWIVVRKTDGMHSIIARGPKITIPKYQLVLRYKDNRYEAGTWDGKANLVSSQSRGTDKGQWVHLIGVYDGRKWSLYRNGQLATSIVSAVGPSTVDADWFIGRSKRNDRYFEGGICDVRIYKRALAPRDIAALYRLHGMVPRSTQRTRPKPIRTAPQAALQAGPQAFPEVPASEQLPIPSESIRISARKQLAEAVGLSSAKRPADKLTLMNSLLSTARTTSKAVDKYVLFTESLRLAIEIKAVSQAINILKEIEMNFQMTPFEILTQRQASCRRLFAGSPEDMNQLAGFLNESVELAIAFDQYPVGSGIASLAIAASRRAKDKVWISTTAAIKRRFDEIKNHHRLAYGELDLESSLTGSSKDPNLKQAEFIAIVKGNWKSGLPHLAKLSGPFQRIAKADLAKPETAQGQADVAEKWWKASEKESGIRKQTLRGRAKHWYTLALGRAEGILKLTIEKRLEAGPTAGPKTPSKAPASPNRSTITGPEEIKEKKQIIQTLTKTHRHLFRGVRGLELIKVYDAGSKPLRQRRGTARKIPNAYSTSPWAGDQGATGYIISGPYASLQPGKYVAVARIMRLSKTNDYILSLNVAHNVRFKLADESLTGQQCPLGQWYNHPAVFTVDRPLTGVEYRIWQRGHPVAVDRIYIYKIK